MANFIVRLLDWVRTVADRRPARAAEPPVVVPAQTASYTYTARIGAHGVDLMPRMESVR
ncbi:hypothetical protein GCM10010218_47320 [Streptomyces mashuensis]|uniref:Uncharacterized protein n=1 Tax=Streptomyces mashuensis TaxID=33904 RepID=A0A919EEW1_9ACTN|nr:hypothetical protein [Streptomyces mashuensis]GHF60425.1 hypothetical protein GCM10010218_47320 [Streptomyces mashuensis]